MKRVIITLTTLAVASSVSLAQHRAPAKPRPHQPQTPEQVFAKLDKNHDGALSLDEFLAGPAGQNGRAKAAEHFKMLDRDGDGKVILAEFLRRPEPPREEQFKKLDTNGDGSLSLDEFKAGPAGQRNPAMVEEYFKRMDQNGDGKVTLREFLHPNEPPREELFKRLDTNGDGLLSLDEFMGVPPVEKPQAEDKKPVEIE